MKNKSIAIIGLEYVGLLLAHAFDIKGMLEEYTWRL